MATSTPAHRQLAYRPDIDGLRAVAVLAVVVNHASPSRLPGGFVGVDVFFVISGFLITGVILQGLHAGSFTFTDFYARRVRRIFPALSLVLFASLVTGWFVLSPAEYEDLGANAAAGAGFVSNLLLWKQTSYFAPAALFKPLLHLWSLGIEEQYYAVWPLTVVALWKWRYRLIPIVAISAVSFALSAALSASRPTAAFYSPATRMWELLLGSITAFVGRTRGEPIASLARLAIRANTANRLELETRLREVAAWIGVLLIGVAMGALRSDYTFPGYWVLLPTAGTAALICAGPDAWISRNLLSNRLVVSIGLISYPLYLWHWPVLTLIRLRSPEHVRLVTAGALIGVFVAAWVTYKLVEAPIRRSRSARVVAWLSLSQALLFLGGLALVGLRGVQARFDATQQKLFAIDQAGPPLYGARYRHASTCSLELEQSEAEFLRSCGEAAAAADRSRQLLLWGDSFAAHLVPGIAAAIGDGMDFYELTSEGCPPIVESTGSVTVRCTVANHRVLGLIRQQRPGTVMLAARWNQYGGYAKVETTIRELKTLGIRRVVLIGSSAQYTRSVPRLLVNALDRGALPQRLRTPMHAALVATDSVLRTIAARTGSEFVSPLSAQCTPAGCLVSLDGSADSVTIWDRGHLTTTGSTFIAERVLRRYLTP